MDKEVAEYYVSVKPKQSVTEVSKGRIKSEPVEIIYNGTNKS